MIYFWFQHKMKETDKADHWSWILLSYLSEKINFEIKSKTWWKDNQLFDEFIEFRLILSNY